jgi:hypothetical protein
MKQKRILLVGSLPPPIGGVSIHIQRLMDGMKLKGLGVDIIESKSLFKFSNIGKILKANIIHVHLSKPKLKFISVLIFKLFLKKVVITNHGKVGSKGFTNNLFDTWANGLANVPIVLNDKSFEVVRKANRKTRLITAFIYPSNITPLPQHIESKVQGFVKKFPNNCYCTNAYSIKFDAQGGEIYSIKALVKQFEKMHTKGLIISEPSGEYQAWYQESGVHLSENILFISENHDFINVIVESSGLIRATTTDGDSLSVREALFKGKPVFATNCVDRPEGCTVFDLEQMSNLEKLLDNKTEEKPREQKDAINELNELYHSLMC